MLAQITVSGAVPLNAYILAAAAVLILWATAAIVAYFSFKVVKIGLAWARRLAG